MTIRKIINKYIVIAALTGVFCLCVMANVLIQARNLTASITDKEEGFVDICAAGNQEVKLYLINDRAYFLLPSCTKYDAQTVSFDEGKYSIKITGKKVKSGDLLAEYISPGETLDVSIKVKFGGNIASSLTVLSSENIPSVYITTKSGSMEAVKEDKSVKEPGQMTCVLADGSTELAADFDYIKARGRSSFSTTDKKSYRVKFDKDVKLLSLNESDEILFVGNAFDSSKMRNYISYQIARSVDAPYTVNTEYVDLYLNGEYAGNYLVTDKMKDGERLELEPGKGYLLEMNALKREDDEGEDNTYFLFNGDATMDVVYPENIDEKTLSQVGEKIVGIKDKILSCESTKDYEEIKDKIDVNSFIAMFLTDELTDELDPNRYSTYFYIGNDGKMYAGPAWDYDKAWGAYRARGQYVEYNSFRDGLPEWMYNNSDFRADVKEAWNLKYSKNVRKVLDEISLTEGTIKASVEMDYVVNGLARYQNVDTGNYDANVKFLKYFIEGRYSLVDEMINSPESLCRIQVVMDNGARSLYVKKGERINERQLKFLCEFNDASFFEKEDGSRFLPGEIINESIALNAVEGKIKYKFEFADSADGLITNEPSGEEGTYHKIRIINLMAEGENDGSDEFEMTIYVEDGDFVDAKGLEYIYKKYDSEQLNFENGCRFWEAFPVYCDLTLYANMDSDDNH